MNVGSEDSPVTVPRFRSDSACRGPSTNPDRRDAVAGRFGAPTGPRPQPAIHNSPRDRSERSRGTYRPRDAPGKHRHKLMPQNMSKQDRKSRQVTVSNGFIAESSTREPARPNRPQRTPTGGDEKVINSNRTGASLTRRPHQANLDGRSTKSTRRLDADTATQITPSDHMVTFSAPMPRFVASTCNYASHSRPGICKFFVVFRS